MQTKTVAVYVANSTRLLYLDVRGTCISVDSTPDGWFYSTFASTFVTTRTIGIGSVIRHRPQWILPCLNVTLSNIIPLLIYRAVFVSPMLYHVLSHLEIKSEHKYPLLVGGSVSPVNILRICKSTFRRPNFYLLHVRSLPYIYVTRPTNCKIWFQIKPNLDVSWTLDAG